MGDLYVHMKDGKNVGISFEEVESMWTDDEERCQQKRPESKEAGGVSVAEHVRG